ncbi:ribokinase [Clostridium aminobutyricum]|uniref:Ribokinase n=1 Tax=Clostridium aminobutyricum TaxID=33953 RepID=A0A939D883_CLOAM|nr:ribokinase [Clostridium aminobutyricum]MBN7772951.1 ribokinase [Clostridium aminobutyricum]
MITVVGSLNMDLVVFTDKIPRPGETVLGKNFQQVPGGKGANQADAAAKLGASVHMVGCVGDDSFGSTLKDCLYADGVHVDYVLTKPNISTGVAVILVEASGDNCITVAPGANFSMSHDNILQAKEVIKDSEVLLLQLEIPLEIVKTAILTAKEAGKKVILNPAPAQELDEEILDHIDLLTPNETELELLSGHKTDTLENIELAGKILLNRGVKELVITLGSSGCLHMTKKATVHYEAYKVQAVDTTAAGDSFNAALAVHISAGKTMEEAITFAMKVGALTVTKEGAQTSLPLLREVESFEEWMKGRAQG